jgi:nicotinamide mononucleotide transporter
MDNIHTEPTFIEIASTGILSAIQAMSYWEVIAVVLGVAYLVLAMRENSWCWYAAFGSTAIFSWLFFDVSLVMESALNVYYLVMAVYGWYVWNKPKGLTSLNNEKTTGVSISTWSGQQHVMAIGGVVILSLLSGYLLSNHTTAVMPYLDSFTTWGAVLTTYMVAKKVLENWLYWIVIDTLAIYLYVDRELYLTAFLMIVYVVLAIFGFKIWLKTYQKNNQLDPALAVT